MTNHENLLSFFENPANFIAFIRDYCNSPCDFCAFYKDGECKKRSKTCRNGIYKWLMAGGVSTDDM